MDYSPRMNRNLVTCRSAAAGSMVLLKNTHNTLPFSRREDGTPLRVAVFGIGQIRTCFGAHGTPWHSVNILDGLCASETLAPDAFLAQKYRAWALAHPGQTELQGVSTEEAAEENDAAVAVITRSADDHRLTLTDAEDELLRTVCESFSRTVLLLNTPGFLELGAHADRFGAIVLVGLAGQELGTVCEELLTGKLVPTGHLAHSWPETAADYEKSAEKLDCFVGYRYFDSFGTAVRYPFGFGLGYGATEMTAVSVGLEGIRITVTAEILNRSETYFAQELVQVYFSNPASQKKCVYTLDCFRKTRLLAPGESETVRLSFPITECAVFHADSAAFVLEEGFYDIRVGVNSRATYLAGSVRLMRSAIVQPVQPLHFTVSEDRSRDAFSAFTYPEEQSERDRAHACAIRFSSRDLPRICKKKGDRFTGCRADGKSHTLSELKRGECSVFSLIASMDDEALRRFVCDFGFCPSELGGAMGASAALERYEIPAFTVAGRANALELEPEIADEDGKTVKRRFCTVFPSPSTLACSFDGALVRAVADGIGREMREYGVQLFLAPGSNLQRTPMQAGFADCWSEDPVVSGIMSVFFAEGMKPYGAAVLNDADDAALSMSQSAFRDVYALGFEIASGAGCAFLLPEKPLCGEQVAEDSKLIRSMILDWHYSGMFLADNRRYEEGPDRVMLEKSALRILKALLPYC